MRFVQPHRHGEKSRKRTFLTHPATIAAALAFNIAVWPTPTSDSDYKPAAPGITLHAPVETIMAAGVRNGAISSWRAQTMLQAPRDEIMNWQYIYLPREVEEYYGAFETAIAAHCEGQLAKCPGHVQEYGATLYKNFRLNPEFRAWDRAHRETFILRAANDPVLIHARQYWNVSRRSPHHINLGERREIARHVIALYNETYADGLKFFRPPAFRTMDLHPDIAGQYVHGIHEVRMRGNDLLWQPFDRVMRIIVHEARHGVQSQLSLMTRSKAGMAYLEAQGIAREVKIFALIKGPGRPAFTSVNDQGYLTSPVEADSYARQVDGNRVGAGNLSPSELFSHLDEADRSIAGQRHDAAKKYGTSRYVRRAPAVS